jgi:hypothetical protein
MLVDVPEWRPDILREHVEELEALWGRRRRSIRSPEADGVGLRRIDSRLDAHADALVLAGEQGWPLLQAGLRGEPDVAGGAGLARASARDREADRLLLAALDEVEPLVLWSIGQALALRAGPELGRGLLPGAGAKPVRQALAWLVQAAHGLPLPPRCHWPLLRDPDAAVRAAAWRVEARLGPTRRDDPERLIARDYQPALADPDPTLRAAVLEAAARSGQPWLLEHLREVARRPAVSALPEHLIYAALAEPVDAPAVLALGRTAALGWDRFRILALFGRATAVEELLRTMKEAPAVEGALAGAAFFRITGVDVERPERLPLAAPGAPADELTEEIKACDAEKAEQAWHRLAGRFASTGRWARGQDVDQRSGAELPASLDLETRWGAHLRHARRTGTAVILDEERLPFAP